jgi:hypothetical protein
MFYVDQMAVAWIGVMKEAFGLVNVQLGVMFPAFSYA